MGKDNSDDPAKPLLAKAKSKKSKSLKVSYSSRKIRKTTAPPTKWSDDIQPPTADDLVDLQKHPRFEFSDTKIYFQDLIEGTGKAVLMEEDAKFYEQEVRCEYNRYNRSAELVKSSDGRPLKYSFCRNKCEGLGIGIQGMKEGGIRRIVILPPKHQSPYKILPPENKSTPPNSEVPDGEIFYLKLLKVGKSNYCFWKGKFENGNNSNNS